MRKWAGSIAVTEVPVLVRNLYEGWMLRKGVREKIQLAKVWYEEGSHDNVLLIAELKDGTELVFDVASPPTKKGTRQRTRR